MSAEEARRRRLEANQRAKERQENELRKKALARTPRLINKAIRNLRRHGWPSDGVINGPNSTMLSVGGEEKVGWILVWPHSGSSEYNTRPHHGFYLLDDGRVVCRPWYGGEAEEVQLDELGQFIVRAAESLEAISQWSDKRR